jgi:hypothetical protein
VAFIDTGGIPTVQGGNPSATKSLLSGPYHDRVAQIVRDRFAQAENHCKAKFERFYRYEKLIHMISKKKQFDWKSNAFLPYAYAMSEQAAATKHESIFGTRPYVTVRPRAILRDPQAEDVASRRQALIDYHLTAGSESAVNEDFGLLMLRLAERYGTTVAMVSPTWETKKVRYRAREFHPTALGPISRISWKTAEQKLYNVRTSPCDLTDFFPQPGFRVINGPDGMRWCFFRSYRTKDELLDMEASGLIGPEVGGQFRQTANPNAIPSSVEMITDESQQDANEYKLRRLFVDRYDDTTRYHDPYDTTVELIDAFMVMPIEAIDPDVAFAEEQAGLDPRRRWVVLANRKTVLQDVALPWSHGMWPFVKMDCVPDPYDFYGKGTVEPIEHLCYVGNEIVNLRLDNVKVAVNRLIGVKGDNMPAGWKRRLLSQPFGVLDTGSGSPRETIQALELGDVTSSSYSEQQQIFTLMQEARGINETMLGAPGGPERTLGEHQLKAMSSTRRLRFEIIGQAYQLLGGKAGLSAFFMALDRQYMPTPFYADLVQPMFSDRMMEPVEIGSDVLAHDDQNFVYFPTGATEGIDKMVRRADLSELMKFLEPLAPLIIPAGFDWKEMIDIVLKTYDMEPSRFWPQGQGMQGPGMAGTMSGPGMPGVPPGAMPPNVAAFPPRGGAMPAAGNLAAMMAQGMGRG